MILLNFGDKIRNLLKENEMTRKDLAYNTNISLSTLGNYICNLREPDFETLKLLASYFDVSIDYLLNYQSSMTTNHNEDDLLRLYRSLDADLQELGIEQFKTLKRHNLNRKPIASKFKKPKK